MAESHKLFMAGIKSCLPTILGYWSIGFSAGVIGASFTFNAFEIFLLATFLYAGSSQFIFYSLAYALVAPINIVIAVTFVNMRYLLMSSSIATYFRNQSLLKNFIIGVQLTDETFGVAANYGKTKGSIPFSWMLGLNMLAYLNWISANIVGVVVAHQVPPEAMAPLQFSLIAMFIGLVVLGLKGSDNKYFETLAAIMAGCCVIPFALYLDSEYSVVLSSIVATTVVLLIKRWKLGKTSTLS